MFWIFFLFLIIIFARLQASVSTWIRVYHGEYCQKEI